MVVQLHRRTSFLVLSHEVEGLEPQRERTLGGVDDGAGGARCLAMAAVALLELLAGQLAAAVIATVRAEKSIGPAPLIEGVEAWVFGSVEREGFVEADSFLKPHWAARHGDFNVYQRITWWNHLFNVA